MEYIDPNFNTVPTELINKFLNLKSYLNEQDKEGNVLLLYRGEQQQNIHERLFAGATGRRDDLPFHRAFYFGDKARHFSSDNFDPRERNFLTNINDCSDATFTFIFERIGNVLTTVRNKLKVRENTSQRFRDYFLNGYNLDSFLARVNTSLTPSDKLKVRDYFLYFLHGAGHEGIRNETMLVSTSIDKYVASRFAGYFRKTGNQDTRVVFHYFVPKPFQNFAISPWLIGHHSSIVESLYLPTYKSYGLYPSQREVAIKGALLPHYILGIGLIAEKKFIINPHIINIDEDNLLRTLVNGIPIDQEDFSHQIFDTGYIRWGQTDSRGNFEQFDV